MKSINELAAILKDLVSGGLVRTIKDVAATAKKSRKG